MSCTLWPDLPTHRCALSVGCCRQGTSLHSFPFLRASSSSRLLLVLFLFLLSYLYMITECSHIHGVASAFEMLRSSNAGKAPFSFDTIVQALFVVILFSGPVIRLARIFTPKTNRTYCKTSLFAFTPDIFGFARHARDTSRSVRRCPIATNEKSEKKKKNYWRTCFWRRPHDHVASDS